MLRPPPCLAIVLLACGIVLPACGDPEKAPAPPEAELRAVYEAVLNEYARPGVLRLVVDPRRMPAFPQQETAFQGVRPASVTESLREVRPDTVADFEASAFGLLPRDLAASVPIEWLDEAGWNALPADPPESDEDVIDARWRAFHRKFHRSAGWIIFSRIGLSRDVSQAVVAVSAVKGGLDGSGLLVLLAKEGGRWRVRKRVTTWVS